jgi:hypothetical protein
MTELQRAFFEDLAQIEDAAMGNAREALSGPEVPAWVENEAAVATLRATLRSRDQVDALATFVKEMVHEAVHSVLVAIDGGSASAEVGRVELVNEAGVPLGDALHELYVDYLLETGRMS